MRGGPRSRPVPRLRSGAAALAALGLLAGAGCSSGHPDRASDGGAAPGGGTGAGSPSSTSHPAARPDGAGGTWATFQNGTERLGVAAPQPSLARLRPVWSAPVDGAVYAQPLVAGGLVIVVTEADDVYALDAGSGRVVWHVNLGRPLTDVAGRTGCGDVDPIGITSTPAIDTTAGVVYAVAEVATRGGLPVHHELAAIDLRTGRVIGTRDVDPPLPAGENPAQLLQRAALALANGRVYVGYGGQYGDCGRYHGWLVAAPVVGRVAGFTEAATAFDVTPASSGGAIWNGGSGPAVGAFGAVYATTGNPNSPGAAPWAEAVVKLTPGLGPAPLAVFQDRSATGDLDLASGGPVLLPGDRLFAVGKAEVGYVLRQSDLTLVAMVRGRVCGSDPDGGSAYDAALGTLYVPCRGGGIQEIHLAAATLGWRAGSVNSTPILVDGGLWALSYPEGRLEELDPATGRVLQDRRVGQAVANFAAPSSADGLLLVPAVGAVVAFRGAAS